MIYQPFSSRHEHAPREPLAVVGIGCRFPGGIDSPAGYWNALLAGVDAIRPVPPERWNHARFHDPSNEKFGVIRNAKGGFIDAVDQFDAEFFGYFPTEAQRLDPQQRLLLEVTHEAMEDAGLRRDQLDGSRTSVFVGSFMYDYLAIQAATEQRDEINPYVAMGTAVSSLANRISYDFNLKGPSISLDTACSSSLVAVHLACRSLWGGEADMAIAGGVNVMLRPESSIMLSKAGFLNSDQYCKAFDAAANGYVRGEGVGVVILKPLSRAQADGDAIYAVVRGTAVNQDGFLPEGFTVPSVFAQIALLKTVYSDAGIDPLTVDFVEAHGTGTAVGDPIETLALGAVLGRDRPPGSHCLLGSMKTNLGHLEGAAGIAGFIKGVLTAHHGIVPPNLHFHQPNPGIDFEDLKLEVPTHPTLLERQQHPVTVGINSFGAGGTNAHVVVQEAPGTQHSVSTTPIPTRTQRPTLYLLTAGHRDSLRVLAQRHARFLGSAKLRFDDAAYSAFVRRSRYEHVLAVVGTSAREAAEKLRKFAEGQADPATLATRIAAKKRPRLAFIFSGQGGQWIGMGQQLMQNEPVFRHTLEDIDTYFQEIAGWSVLDEICKGESDSRIDNTEIVQPAVMAIQIALFKLYEHYGIRPRAVMGHSIGEVAAAFAAGALSLEDAVRVIYHRSQAQSKAAGKGGMLAVGVSIEEARKLIDGRDARVSIGAVNGPQMLTLSGDAEPLAQIAQLLESRGIFNRPVRVQVAYHSHHMEPILGLMMDTLAEVTGSVATTPLYSTVTGRREAGPHLTADYWCRNARAPVLFTDALAAMLGDGYNTFLEIGPHPLLIHGAEALFKKRSADAMIGPAMTRREPEVVVFLQSLARLAVRGIAPNTAALFGNDRRFVRLPLYAWRKSRYWFETPALTEARRGAFAHPFLKRQTPLVSEEGLAVWEAALAIQKFPYLHDHRVDGAIVFPATAHIELAWAAASEQFQHQPFFLENLHFESALILPEDSRHPPQVHMEVVSGEGDYRICSRPGDAPAEGEAAVEQPWTRHSSGRINTTHDRFEKAAYSLSDLKAEFAGADSLPVERFYETIRTSGLDYGPKFQGIKELLHKGHDTLARVELTGELHLESARNFFHPALFDACLHVIFADGHCNGDPSRVFLPVRLERVRFNCKPTKTVWAYVRVSRNDEQYLCSDTFIFNEDGTLAAEALGLVCKRLAGSGARSADAIYDGCFEYRWLPTPRDAERHGRLYDCTTAVLIADKLGVAQELATRLASEGVQPLLFDADADTDFDDLLADVALDRRTMIVFLAGLADAGDADSWPGLDHCPAVPMLLHLAQVVQKREAVPRVYIVTNCAAGAPDDRHLDLAQAILHGMVRVINNECANVPITVIDLDDPARAVAELCDELLHVRRDRDESEIAMRRGARLVRQLVPVDRESAEQAASTEEEGVGGAYRADQSEPGLLDQIAFRRLNADEPGPDEVEIAVEAAALNFKDIMNAMGVLPAHAVAGGLTGHRLGLEVAGRVLRVGANIEHVRPGEAVIARVAEGFRGRVIAPGHCVVRRPDCLTAVQAAAIPVVFITAWYSLVHLARIQKGETVLIHSAAGGVGGAAIQIARRAGATVIATAGTKEKRDHLRKLGIQHVFDSRSIDFYNHVLAATNGRGVDIVLNSLTGRFIAQSIKCLAPFGRFIELGKADIYRNNKLNMERLGENIAYFVVDVDRLAAQKPALHRQVFSEVVDLFNAPPRPGREGLGVRGEHAELTPLEITEFPIAKLAEALKFMTRSAYHGKIVVNMQGERVTALPPRTASFRADRSYLITGGASGFGLEIARWMADRGARNLILASRSGCKLESDRRAVAAMIEAGANVRLVRIDIADPIAVRRLMGEIKEKMPGLAGVIHGAAVMDDALLENMDMKRFARVFQPKAQGAWNLHEATMAAGAELDFFVMLSSISSVLGFYGQVNYVAANYFQDALAVYRRQRGLPGTAINLGVMGQYAGLSRTVNDAQDVIGLLESHGMLVTTLPDILGKLEAVLIQRPVQRMTGRFDWARFRTAYPHLARDARFIDLLSDAGLSRAGQRGRSNLRATLAELKPQERRERLQKELAAALARILDIPPEQLDTSVSIDTLGLDSLMLSQLRNWMLRALDINVMLIKLLKGPSIITLAADLLAQLESGKAEGAKAGEAAASSAGFALADLDGVRVLNPWLIRGRGPADAPCRLICFHSMGVGASLFTNFLLNPPDGFDILAVQTPGRENRSAEAVAPSVEKLAAAIAPELAPLFDRPVVIWGHSYGGIVAREVVRRLREDSGCEPAHFVTTGTIPPHLIQRWQNREVILKAMVADNSPEYLISLSRYADDPELIKAILPGMRRDYPLLTRYRYEEIAPFDFPITAFAARQDDVVYSDEIRQWAQHTHGDFELIEVDGDHWFLNRNRDLINRTLREIAGGLGGQRTQISAILQQPHRRAAQPAYSE